MILKRTLVILSAGVFGLLAMAAVFPAMFLRGCATALAAQDLPPTPPGLPAEVEADPLGAVLELVTHAQAGAWVLAVAIVLALAVALFRRLRARVPWLGTDRGGAMLASCVGLGGVLAAALAGGVWPGAAVITGALVATWAAVGGRQWLRRLLWPEDGGTPWLDWAWLRALLGDSAPQGSVEQAQDAARREFAHSAAVVQCVRELAAITSDWRAQAGSAGGPWAETAKACAGQMEALAQKWLDAVKRAHNIGDIPKQTG